MIDDPLDPGEIISRIRFEVREHRSSKTRKEEERLTLQVHPKHPTTKHAFKGVNSQNIAYRS